MAHTDDEIRTLIEEFDFLGDWEERYSYLIDLGRALPRLPDEAYTDTNKVKGCASQVWMLLDVEDGTLHIRGDSDAHIVKGLIALLIRLYDDRSPEEALKIDPVAVLNEIGLADNLSPQRSNGLASMIQRIRQEASSHQN